MTSKEEVEKRYKDIYTQHKSGKTFKQIAKELGISTGRVQQINAIYVERNNLSIERFDPVI